MLKKPKDSNLLNVKTEFGDVQNLIEEEIQKALENTASECSKKFSRNISIDFTVNIE